MKKKNVIGHMVAQKNAEKGFFRRWGIFPRICCLLLALFIWLLVMNLSESTDPQTELPPGFGGAAIESVSE